MIEYLIVGGIYGLLAIGLVYALFQRLREKEQEDFEERDN